MFSCSKVVVEVSLKYSSLKKNMANYLFRYILLMAMVGEIYSLPINLPNLTFETVKELSQQMSKLEKAIVSKLFLILFLILLFKKF